MILSTVLLLNGCTTINNWHHTHHHHGYYYAKPSYQPQPVNSNLPPQTPYTYTYHVSPFPRTGTPYTQPAKLNPYEVITNNYNPAPYDSLAINGTFHVEIKGNQSYPCVRITGPRYALKYINVFLQNGQLNIIASHSFGVPNRLPVAIEIDTGELQNISLTGNGTTIISGIGTQGLNLNVAGNGQVNLNGASAIVLYQLDITGNATVGMYWVNTNNLLISAGGGSHITLAGVATNLDVKLSGGAVLDAKYLRSQEAYVKTRDYACAWIFAQKSLSAYANNYSDIYYYPDPIITGPYYVHDHGSVMRMAGLPY